MRGYRLQNRRAGNSLVFVLMILAVFGVVAAALTTFTLSSQRSDAAQQIQRQAYFTARSAVRAVAQQITSDSGWAGSHTLPLTAKASGVYLNNSGRQATVTVDYKAGDTGTIKVSCSAEYQGQTGTAVAYLKQQATKSSSLDNLFYLTDASAAYELPQSYYYSVSSSPLQMVIQGSIRFTDKVLLTGNMIAAGNVTLDRSATISEIETNGNLTFGENNSVIGSVTLPNTSAINNQADNITGSVTRAAVTIPTYTLPVLTPGSAETPADASRILNADYVKSPGNLVSGTRGYYYVKCSEPLYLQDFDGSSWGNKNIVLTAGDASKDVILVVSGDAYVKGEINFYVDTANTRNVLIYLTGSSSQLSFEQARFGGTMQDFLNGKISVSTPRVYILGNGSQTVKTIGNNSLHTYIYLPYGTADLEGTNKENAPAQYAADLQGSGFLLTGGVTAKNLTLDYNSPKFLYVSPDYNNMPSGLIDTAGTPKWAVTSWASQ